MESLCRDSDFVRPGSEQQQWLLKCLPDTTMNMDSGSSPSGILLPAPVPRPSPGLKVVLMLR